MKKIFLILLSLFIIISLCEIFLIIYGPYNYIAKAKFKKSISWYERPSNFTQQQPHPDLIYNIENYFDKNGIKNCKNNKTVNEKNLIGIFGDSMVENVFVNSDFEFSCLLNKSLKNYKVLNFGVGGYNFEQSFARYLKYQNLNFKYVFYFFTPGDHKSIGLMSIDDDNNLKLNSYKSNFFKNIISKLNITYLLIDAYYVYKNLYKNYHFVNRENYHQLLDNKFSNAVRNNYVFDNQFKKKVLKFNEIVSKNNAKLIFIIYPDDNTLDYFKKNFTKKKENDFYFVLDKQLKLNKNYIFKNDNHWNEKGNVFFAENLLRIFFELNIINVKISLNEIYKKIDLFYSSFKKRKFN